MLKQCIDGWFRRGGLAGVALGLSAIAAQASAPVPAPLAGTLGPAGLAVAVAGYGAYRFIRWRRDRQG